MPSKKPPPFRPQLIPESFLEVHFPLAGIDLSRGYGDQQPRALPDGGYARTTRTGQNVRGFEPDSERARGGARPGLSKYISAAVVADWIIQELAVAVGSGYAPPGGAVVQQSNSGRTVLLVAVSQGNVYTCPAGGTAWSNTTNATGATPPLNYTGVLYSTTHNQKVYFADGTNRCYYDPSVQAVYKWAATEGSLPVDAYGNCPRLICTWRGRIVESGLLYDPHNVFMSAVGTPTDFDYGPEFTTPTQAVAFNASSLGLVGDVVTSLVPYTDDVLFIGGDHTLWMLNGDPMMGGQLDLVSDSIGMAWGIPWAKDPYGNVYFVSNKCGIYLLTPGQKPQRISGPIEQLLVDFNTGTTTIRLLWNDRFQGLHCFFTPTIAPAATTHLFWEQRTGAFWTDVFANTNHDPLTCCTFDGNEAGDRVALIGSWDGYIRCFDVDATTDDGTNISSSVVIGPLNSKNLDEFLIKDLQAVLGSNSGSVTWAVHAGVTAEAALATTAVATGTWTAGRGKNTPIRRSAHALYIRLTSTSAWSLENIRSRISQMGKVRRRGP